MTATLAYKKAPFFVVVRFAEGSANFMEKRSSDFKKQQFLLEKRKNCAIINNMTQTNKKHGILRKSVTDDCWRTVGHSITDESPSCRASFSQKDLCRYVIHTHNHSL